MRGEIFTLLFVTWPCLQALFIVESEQDSYDGELHDKITMGCRFSSVPDVSHISVTWERVKPLPTVNVYRLYQGSESPDFTDEQFQQRVRLLKEELKNSRAVIELSQLRLNDSGTYRCIVIQEDVDYKQTTLTVRAPYKAIKKTVRTLSDKKVELTCESRGLPLARVTWSDGMESDLTNRSATRYVENSDGVFVVTSRLYVTHDVNNYTCSYWTDGSKTSQTATFSIPDEIPEESKSTSVYVAIAVTVTMCILSVIFGFMLLCRRKKGQASLKTSADECESPGQNLTVTSIDHLLQKNSNSKENTNIITSELQNGKSDIRQDVVNQRHPESNKTAETKTDSTLPHALLSGGNIYSNIQYELLDLSEKMLQDGKKGPNEAS